MFKDNHAFSGFSVNDLAAAKEFYGDKLGIDTTLDEMGLALNIAGSNPIFVYNKENHVPAEFTILNFPVDDIDQAVDALTANGVTMERYDNMPFQQDEKGIARGKSAGMGPDIAWFKDPAGNVLAVLSN
jgi:predicted enzyme related to lactoylglutathione lyase